MSGAKFAWQIFSPAIPIFLMYLRHRRWGQWHCRIYSATPLQWKALCGCRKPAWIRWLKCSALRHPNIKCNAKIKDLALQKKNMSERKHHLTRKNMRKLKLTVEVEASDDISDDRVCHLLDMLINIGLADAEDTVNEGIDDADANDVLNFNIHSPKPACD
jgi:hypothetical protein